jgi:hypothetical protein
MGGGGNALPILVRSCRSTDFCPEEVHFLDDEFLHAFDRILLLEEKVEFLPKNKRFE